MQYYNKGIALYLVVVITGIGLAIALGVADIVFLESRVTRGLLPSYVAFFAADAGTECASYWHFNKDKFDPAAFWPAPVTCSGNSVKVTHSSTGDVEIFDFAKFNYPDPAGNPYCVTVRVAKATVSGFVKQCTAIRSSGQNLACGSAVGENSVERTLIVRDPEDCRFNF